MEAIETCILWFFLYSIIGWCWETLICSIRQRKFINRGFLNGPYCPIYGYGAILNILVLGAVENPVLLFFAGALLSCSLEYLTSWGMEKLFHARWWDYSKRKFNINGRVCLLGAVVFGAFAVLLIKILHPFFYSFMAGIPYPVKHYIVVILIALYLADNIYTFTSLSKFNERLKELSSELAELRDSTIEAANRYTETFINSISESETFERVNNVYEKFSRKINAQGHRTLRAFPEFKSMRYEKIVQDLKKFIKRMKNRKRKV